MRAALAILLFLNLCQGDESLSAYGASDRNWVLTEINKEQIRPRVTIVFPEAGRIEGSGPCNRYTAKQLAPYPWFQVEEIAATKRACSELAFETEFFKSLGDMTISEISGKTLILTNDADQEMIFVSE